MAKSKRFTTLEYSKTGEELIFDQKTFEHVFRKHAVAIDKARNKKIGGQAEIFRHFSEFCIDRTNADIDSLIERSKKWLGGHNSPSVREELRLWEDYFDCSFLMPRPLENTSNKGDYSPMKYTEVNLAERAAARELYQLMTDLIRIHQKTMYCFWYADFPVLNNTKWMQYVPDDYPVLPDIQHQIRKLSFDLPQEVRDDALRLAQEIYGWPSIPDEKETGCPYPLMDYDYESFLAFLKASSATEESWNNSGEVMYEWFEFSEAQTQEYYDILDEIFSDYMS